ncbi:MAG: methionine--tRNA ligase [Planctomycetota bacterium]
MPADESTNTPPTDPYYVTTPIYYVNDRPHIGHCYTTLVADVAARMARLVGGPGREVLFLTGTDEHAEKVSKAAEERGLSPMDWATQNAERFKDAFRFMNFSHDDFVRTTEPRHKDKAAEYIERLVRSGDIELGDYEGWYDPSQEEYLTETVAKEHDFKSPVTGRDLEKRTEQNYFFRLDKYEGWLKEQIETDAIRVLPEARKNEVLGRIKQGLQRVPVSRKIKEGDADWGITMPGDDEHRIYVWIEALCNYLTVVDNDDRQQFWPATVHFMAKDILWFHAVIWPAMLKALKKPAPKTVYAHAYFIAEGKKMSKSLGNFIEIDQLKAYAERYSLDAVRWYLATQGPLGATDSDFAYSRFVEVYNADLANSVGNSTSRVANMIDKYLGGSCDRTCNGEFGLPGGKALPLALRALESAGKPARDPSRTFDFATLCREAASAMTDLHANAALEPALASGQRLVDAVDDFVSFTAPFTLAKQLDTIEHADKALQTILYTCAETLRIASLLLYPAMPEKMADLWRRWHCDHLTDPNDCNSPFKAPLAELARFGDGDYSLKPGQQIEKGDALFMRADAKEAAPEAPST